jgi:2-polyprenyl-6-methoxyphenol hydroxylase-like FAD-dependent oxidoreductase
MAGIWQVSGPAELDCTELYYGGPRYKAGYSPIATPATSPRGTRIEWLLADDPWFRGRAIVIGDAAHACPPLVAHGAAMCAEDAVVLAGLVTGDLPVEQALPALMARRMPRVERRA